MAFKLEKLTLRERIEQERVRLEVAKETRPPVDFTPALNTIDIPRETPVQRRVLEPTFYDFGRPQEPVPIASTPLPSPIAHRTTTVSTIAEPARKVIDPTKQEAKPVVEEEREVPFWQRALQVFSAPFDWIDKNIIKTGLSAAGTALGLVPDVQRQPGEDFWEWKKRSWDEFEVPFIPVKVPWSDDPLKLDIKGVLAFAPWFLIPGVGQVGSATKAGFGIAGTLGKAGLTAVSKEVAKKLALQGVKITEIAGRQFIREPGFLGQAGKLGRALGVAAEASPWGLAEKVVGKALGGALKAAGLVSAKAGEKVFGKIVDVPPSPSVVKFTDDLENLVVPKLEAFQKVRPSIPKEQAARMANIRQRFDRGEITLNKAVELMSASRAVGSLKAKFAVELGDKGIARRTGAEMDELLLPLQKAAESDFDFVDAANALKRLLSTGELPEPRHFVQFSKAYGKRTAEVLGEFARKPESFKDKVLDFLNLPRAVLASGDISGTFRQGLILGLVHPTRFPRAFARQLKAFASEKLTLDMDDALRSNVLFKEATRNGVDFTTVRKGAQLAAKEEPFASNLAQALPFVRKSERAFTTFLNEMRMGAYESAHSAMTAQGATQAQFKLMGDFINMASGRGKLPANLDRYAPLFNTVLFSAKLQASTLQLPRQIGRMFLSDNPYMRKEAAKALLAFVGGGASLVSLLNITNNGKTELDPRSGDFGKIIVGKTRLDVWRGYIQYARFAAQLLTGERKSANGNLTKDERFNIAFRFLQSKTSPVAGLFVDLLRGENYRGEPLFDETTGFIQTARDRLLPLAVQDTIDAMEQYGTNGLWAGLPAATGIGTLTYVNDLVRIKERIARQEGFDSWDEIDPLTQRQIQDTNVELQTAYMDFDRQVLGTAFGDWRNAGQSIEEVFEENVGKAIGQYRVLNC